ncbi:MAG: glycosyltransferase family 39 protein [Caldilineaceae bacterium]|nr:glycosyltransferase family 39 protein [Caldilineaceae bacterium]
MLSIHHRRLIAPTVHQDRLTALLIILVAFTIRVTGLAHRALWYDELQSVTHASLPFAQLLAGVHQFDPHPPLYYAQLHLWLRFGTSDFWIKLNSVFWSLLTVASLYGVGGRRFGRQVGSYAALLFALFPFAIAYAQEARMYALLMFLGVWIYCFTDQLLYGRRVLWASCGLVSGTLAFLYSHGAGFLILFAVTSYALYFLWKAPRQRQARWRRFRLWLALQLLILLYYVPWLYRASTLSVRHTLQPDLPAITNTLSLLLLGFGELAPWLRWGSVLVVLAILVGLYASDGPSRNILLAFIVVPVGITLGISYLYRPIWLHRPLAFTVPFLALGLALAVVRSRPLLATHRAGPPLRYGILALVGVVLTLAAANQQARTYYPWQIREAAHFLQRAAQPGDRIFVADFKVFWGVSWYFVGPGSVNPLQPDNAWAVRNGVTLLAGADDAGGPTAGSCDWLVYRTMDQLPPRNTLVVVQAFDDLIVAQRCSPKARRTSTTT